MEFISLNLEQKEEHEKWIKYFTDNYNYIFLKPSYGQVPYVSQFYDGKIKQQVLDLEYYLLGSYPIYMGTNIHSEMHKQRYSFAEDEYEWHKYHNKLGVNRWGTQAGISIGVLNNMLGRKDLIVESFSRMENYSSILFDDKVEYCRTLDKELYQILEKLYNENI